MPMVENTLYICLNCFRTFTWSVSNHRKPNTVCICNSVPQIMAEVTRDDILFALQSRQPEKIESHVEDMLRVED